MEGSWPITNQRQRVCLYFSPGCWVANLGPGQTDSPYRSPPDIRLPHCFDHKRRRTLLCPCLCHPPGRSSRLWNSRQQRSWKNKRQQVSIPTWGQMKSLCRQAQGIASLQGSSASPERVFIAMLALLSCQASATSSTSEKYWAYFPDPLTFQEVTQNKDPIPVNTDQPHLLGGSYTSYNKDHYPINFNYSFRGLTDDLPLCFNFP